MARSSFGSSSCPKRPSSSAGGRAPSRPPPRRPRRLPNPRRPPNRRRPAWPCRDHGRRASGVAAWWFAGSPLPRPRHPPRRRPSRSPARRRARPMGRRRSRSDVRSRTSRLRTGHDRGRLAIASSLFRRWGRSPGCARPLRAVRPDRSRAARSRWSLTVLPPECPRAVGHRRSCPRPIPIRRARLGLGHLAGACGARPSPEVPSHPPPSPWSARSVREPPSRRSWNPSRRSSSLPSRREGRWQRSPRAGDHRMRRNAWSGAGWGRAGRTASPRRICARTWGRPPVLAALRCARGNPRSRRAHPAAALRVRTRGRRGRCLASPYLAGSSRPHGRNPAGKPGTKDTGRTNRRPPPRLRT